MDRLILTTANENVILRQLTAGDAPLYFDAVDANRKHLSQFGDDTATKYPDLRSVEDSILNPSDPSKIRMGIWDGNTFVGSANLTPDEDGRAAELGYWTDGRYLRKGYASLAANALSRYGLKHFGKVYAKVSTEQTEDGDHINEKSVGVLKKVGFRQTAKQAGKLVFELLDDTEVPDTDFENQLERAFKYPLKLSLGERKGISPEEIKERESYYSSQRLLPDNSPVYIHEYYQKDYEALTLEPDKYALLLAQAMQRLEIVKGNADPGIVITPEIQRVADHEIAHGKMSKLIGVTSAYTVRVLHDPANNIWAIGPSHALLGPAHITKLQSAAICVAPEDVSQGDLLSARVAGYASREGVLEKFYAVYPPLKPEALATGPQVDKKE